MPFIHYDPYSALIAINIGISTGAKDIKIGRTEKSSQSPQLVEKDYKLHHCEVSRRLSISNAGSLGRFA